MSGESSAGFIRFAQDYEYKQGVIDSLSLIGHVALPRSAWRL